MQQVELSVSFVLRATWSDIRDTLLHEIAHAIVGPGHGHDAVWQTAARRIGWAFALRRYGGEVGEVEGEEDEIDDAWREMRLRLLGHAVTRLVPLRARA